MVPTSPTGTCRGGGRRAPCPGWTAWTACSCSSRWTGARRRERRPAPRRRTRCGCRSRTQCRGSRAASTAGSGRPAPRLPQHGPARAAVFVHNCARNCEQKLRTVNYLARHNEDSCLRQLWYRTNSRNNNRSFENFKWWKINGTVFTQLNWLVYPSTNSLLVLSYFASEVW